LPPDHSIALNAGRLDLKLLPRCLRHLYKRYNQHPSNFRAIPMLTPLLPVIVLFTAGALLRRLRGDQSAALVDVVIYFIFPAFVFRTVWALDLGADVLRVSGFALLSVAAGGALGWLTARALHASRETTATFMLLAALGNTSFLGFPFVNAYWGEAGLAKAVIFDQVGTMPMLVIYGTIVAAWGSGNAVLPGHILRQMLSFPPFWALVTGLLLNGMSLPSSLLATLDMVSAALLPVILLAVGMKFSLGSLQGNSLNLALLLSIKMLAVPFVIAVVSRGSNGWDLAARVSVIEAAMPPMVLACVLAIRHRLDENLAVAALGVGMLLSFVTVPLFYFLTS